MQQPKTKVTKQKKTEEWFNLPQKSEQSLQGCF